MQNPALRLVVSASFALLAGVPAGADVVALSASHDTTLYSESGAESNGAGEHFFAGQTRDGTTRRALLRFDVTSIPAGSTVQSVTLTLYLSRTRTGNQNVSLSGLLADWGEAGSQAAGEEGEGAPAETGDATWTHRLYPTAPWSAAGGDFAAAPSATSVVSNGTGFYSWSSAGMVADVQAWLDGAAPNYGWILRGNETDTRVVKRFDSRSNSDANHRPVLSVSFTPPSPTGACCAVDGSCSIVLDPGGACAGEYQGVATSCEPNLCPQPTGACCLPDASASCQEETELSCTGLGGSFQGELTECATAECPVVLTPFLDPLPLPAVAQPVTGTPGGAASYQLAIREVQQQLHSQLPPTTVWGFGDGPAGATYPGPTLEASVDQPVTVTWANDLRDTSQPGAPLRTQHYLPVDLCPEGAAQNADARVVFHLHGAHVSEESDGYPEDTIPPGQQDVYQYPNSQHPATLWYHDHALGITRLNVMMGLAGFYLLRDATEQALGLPSGPYEIPLAIQDRAFRPDGSLRYPAMWEEMFFGDTILVNGKVWPYLNVQRGKYRLRLLNGSTSRTYRLALSNGAPFQVIGMEGGLLPAPVAVSEITLGPGERADAVVDFAPFQAGSEILLLNSAPAPFPGTPGVGVVPNVMKFVVQAQTGDTDPLPAALRPQETLQEASASAVRELHLEKGAGDSCSPFTWRVRSVVNGSIVGEEWHDVTEFPALGATEVWKFVNKSGMTHPMHMHLVMFQVLDRQAFEILNGQITPIGAPLPPPAQEAGWKDTVQVGPNEIVRVIARFANPLDPAAPTYTGRFPYHCHILEHEDHHMMRQYQTVTSCGDGIVGLPAEECDDGGTTPGDGCSAACEVEDECQNGVDDDGDGASDYPADAGCTSATDFLEKEATRPCDNGLDDDGDGRLDYRTDGSGDLGCRFASSYRENPQCQDGLNNDAQPGIDFDGGASVHGGVPLSTPDPQCTAAWRDREAATSRCGLGFELVLLLAPLHLLARRRTGVRKAPRAVAAPAAG